MKGITDYQIIPLISDLYLRPNERFNKQKDWDERKLWYAMSATHKKLMIGPDRAIWANRSQYSFDFFYNLANSYSRSPLYNAYPAIGLLGTQIIAFLDYRERILQKELDKNGFNYTAHLIFPTEDEIKEADTRSKGIGNRSTPPEGILTELVYKILKAS